MGRIHRERLEVKNEQRNKSGNRDYLHSTCRDTDNIGNAPASVFACMCRKGNIAVTQTNANKKSAVKMLAALNFDLKDKEQHSKCTIKAANTDSSST